MRPLLPILLASLCTAPALLAAALFAPDPGLYDRLPEKVVLQEPATVGHCQMLSWIGTQRTQQNVTISIDGTILLPKAVDRVALVLEGKDGKRSLGIWRQIRRPSISAGRDAALAMDQDGTAYAARWANKIPGQMTDTLIVIGPDFAPIPALPKVREAMMGGDSLAFLDEKGKLWVWGNMNSLTTKFRDVFSCHGAPPTEAMVDTATYQLTTDAKWDEPETRPEVPIVELALSDCDTGLWLDAQGDAKKMGWSAYSCRNCGNGATSFNDKFFFFANVSSPWGAFPDGKKPLLVQVAGGGGGSLFAVDTEGKLWGIGGNPTGQLGWLLDDILQKPPEATRNMPILEKEDNRPYRYELFWKTAIYKANNNIWKQLGCWQQILDRVNLLNDRVVSQVIGGGGHVVAFCADGTVWSWGGAFSKVSAKDSKVARTAITPRQEPSLEGKCFRKIACNDKMGLALDNDSTVWTWEWTEQGASSLTKQPGLALDIAMEEHHWLALQPDGNVRLVKMNQPATSLSGIPAERFLVKSPSREIRLNPPPGLVETIPATVKVAPPAGNTCTITLWSQKGWELTSRKLTLAPGDTVPLDTKADWAAVSIEDKTTGERVTGLWLRPDMKWLDKPCVVATETGEAAALDETGRLWRWRLTDTAVLEPLPERPVDQLRYTGFLSARSGNEFWAWADPQAPTGDPIVRFQANSPFDFAKVKSWNWDRSGNCNRNRPGYFFILDDGSLWQDDVKGNDPKAKASPHQTNLMLIKEQRPLPSVKIVQETLKDGALRRCLLTADGRIFSGFNSFDYPLSHFLFQDHTFELGGLSGVQLVYSPWNNRQQELFALASDGSIHRYGWSWKGTEGFRTDFFQPISGFPRLPFIQMAASKEGGVTLAAEGSVWCWGNNTCGQLGDPKMPMGNLREDKRALPVRVQFPTFSPMVRIGAGKETHFAIAADGRIWQWGQCRTIDGENTTTMPMLVPGICLKTVDEARQRQLQDEIIVFEENRKKAVAQKEQARLGQQRKQQEAIWLKKYDLNGNGQLDPEERARAEADAKAGIQAPARDE